MADIKISEMISASSISASDYVELSQSVNGTQTSTKAAVGDLATAVKQIAFVDIVGTLTAGQTSIALSSSAITSNSTFEMFNDLDVPYNSKTVDTTTTPPSITYTFDVQQSDMSVKVRVS